MPNSSNVYIFNPLIALEMAKNSNSEEQIFFYDGQKLDNAPNNCIHVPIDNFVTYFLNSPYPYPQEINFDTMGFSADVQNSIVQNLTIALESVKIEKAKQLGTILDGDLDTEKLQNALYFLLEYIYINDFANENIPLDLVYKLLEATKLFSIHNISPEEKTLRLLQKLHSSVEKQETFKYFYLFHLHYALALLQKNGLDKQEDTKKYFDALAGFNNIPQLINDFKLVQAIFPQEALQTYLDNLANSLFQDDFFIQDILIQKHAVFKFYYLTSIHYDRGKIFKTIFHTLKNVFLSAMEKKLDELVFYLYTPLQLSWGSVSQTQEEFKYFHDTIEKPLENFIEEFMVPKYKIKKNTIPINKKKKIKVGFVQERILDYSVYQVLYILVKALKEYDSNQYEFVIYDLNFQELGGSHPQEVEKLKELGITYVDLHKECVGDINAFYSITKKALQVRRKLIKDKVDILIGMNTRAEYNFLYTTRTAPKQIYWSHANLEYTLKEIDEYICHFEIDSSYKQYKTFQLPIDVEKYNPSIDPKLIQTTRALYPQENFILGSIGRLIKLDDEEYIQAIAAIMKQSPNTIYLACGDGDSKNIQALTKKYGIDERFYFTGRINAHLYGHIIDLWLTPFKLSGGEALQEYMHKGKPFVSLVVASDEWIEEHENKIRRFVYPHSHEKYIEYASALIQSTDLRKEVMEAISKEREIHIDVHQDIQQFIKSILD